MAKKKTHKVIMQINSSFKIQVNNEFEKSFLIDEGKGKLCLNTFISSGDIDFSFNIYRDHILNGSLTFGPITDGFVSVDVNGVVEKKINSVDDAELITTLQGNAKCEIKLRDIYDSNLNSYYVDGDEEKSISIGTASME